MQLTIEEVSISIQIISLAGRIDAASAQSLKDPFRTMTREGRCNIALDLRAVEFIDSTGLGLLTSVLRAARSCGGDVCLIVAKTSPVVPILSIVRFQEVFTCYDTPEAARCHFACK